MIRLVGNKVDLYMGLRFTDGSRPTLGTDMKAGPDYAFLEVPVKLPKTKGKPLVKAGEPVVLTTGMQSTPHRARTHVQVNPALSALGKVRLSQWIIEEGDPPEIEVHFTPDAAFDLTTMGYLVRLYCVE